MSRQFLAGVASVDILVGDKIIANANTLVDSSITVGSSFEDVRGGSGAKLLGKYFHTSTFDVNLTDVLFKLEYLAFQTGSTIEQVADIFTSEQVVLTSGGNGTIVGEPAEYQTYGTIGWATKPGSDTYTTVTFAEKAFNIPGAKDGDIYCVKYISKSNASRKITISSSFIPSEVTLVMTANLYKAGQGDSISGSSKVGTVQILVPRFIFNGSQEISMTATGVANSPIAGSALDNPATDCSEGGYYAIITETITGAAWSDNVFALAVSDSDIELKTGGPNNTQKLIVYALPVNGAAFIPPYEDLTFTASEGDHFTAGTDGVVTASSAGNGTVTVSIKKKPGVEAVANVTVTG